LNQAADLRWFNQDVTIQCDLGDRSIPRKINRQRWNLKIKDWAEIDYFEYEFADKSSLLWSKEQKSFLYLNQTGAWIKSSLDQNIADDIIVDLLYDELGTPKAVSRNIIESLKISEASAIRARCNQSSTDDDDIDLSFPFEEFTLEGKNFGERTKAVEIAVAGISICLSYYNCDIESPVSIRPIAHLITTREIHNSRHAINVGEDEDGRIWAGSTVTGYFYAKALPELCTLLYWMVYKTVEASRDWLVALHAGGVVAGEKPVLVIGPGGAGKSTLTVALMEKYNSYLTDELITITRYDRRILPLPTLPCIKEEGWAAIDSIYPSLRHTEFMERLNRNVKYLSIPAEIAVPDQVVADNALVLFPKFREYTLSRITPLTIGDMIAKILDSGGLIGDISSQQQLSDFGEWISSLEAYELSYDSTGEGLRLIEEILGY